MPKGRFFVPDSSVDGLWFRHRGLTDPGLPQRERDTTQGLMYTTPFRTEYRNVPFPPPAPYLEKELGPDPPLTSIPISNVNDDLKNYKKDNPFSMHNNRHFHEDHGVYFGNGGDTRFYGKTVMRPERQHKTKEDFLQHNGRHIYAYNYRTSYRSNFNGEPVADGTEKPLRRFPRQHREGESGETALSTTTTAAFDKNDTFRTPLQVLASSHEPFLTEDKWKYSFHGLPRIYPKYDLKNHLNRMKSTGHMKTCLF